MGITRDITQHILQEVDPAQRLVRFHESLSWLLEEHRKALLQSIGAVDARFQDFMQRQAEQVAALENRVGSLSQKVGSLRVDLGEYSLRDDRTRALLSKKHVWGYLRFLRFWGLV